MSRIIFCQKLQKEAEGLPGLPYPGELGKKIYLHICKEAWQEWLKRQTMIINEYRLNAADPKSRRCWKKKWSSFSLVTAAKHRRGLLIQNNKLK